MKTTAFNKLNIIIKSSLICLSLLLNITSLKADSLSDLDKVNISGKEYYIYTTNKGESIYGIAKKFGWNQEELININPDAVGSIGKGMKLYYPVSSDNSKESTIVDNNLGSDGGKIKHIVKKGETIYSISRLYDVSLELIYSYNPYANKGIKAGQEIIIPVGQSKTGSSETFLNQPEIISQEDTASTNSNDMVEEESKLTDSNSIAEEPRKKGIRMALILDEPTSNKDIDFVRGSLIRLSHYKDPIYKIDLKVLDGGISTNDLLAELEDYEANIIVSTADKAFPLFLADYSETNNIPIVNVFDLKSDLVDGNSMVVQMLPSSSIFYEKIGEKIYVDNNERNFLAIGEKDSNDVLSTELFNKFGDRAESLSLEDFGSMEPDIFQPALLYSYSTKREDVADFLNNVEHLAEVYPDYDFKIIGRSNWITMTDDFGDKFESYNVYIPSRVWIDEDSWEWKTFVKDYEEMFKNNPVRSIPNYAASGYDIINYFIEEMFEKEGDVSKIGNWRMVNGLQNDIRLQKVSQGSGFINDIEYLIKFNPDGRREKVVVK